MSIFVRPKLTRFLLTKLEKKIGTKLHIAQIRLLGINHFVIDELKVNFLSFSIDIGRLEIKIKFWNILFNQRKEIFSLVLNDFNICYRTADLTVNRTKAHTGDPLKKNQAILLAKKIYTLFSEKGKTLSAIKSLEFRNFSISKQERTVVIEVLQLRKFNSSFSLISKLKNREIVLEGHVKTGNGYNVIVENITLNKRELVKNVTMSISTLPLSQDMERQIDLDIYAICSSGNVITTHMTFLMGDLYFKTKGIQTIACDDVTIEFMLSFDFKINLFKSYTRLCLDENFSKILQVFYDSLTKYIDFNGSCTSEIMFSCSLENVFLQKTSVKVLENSIKMRGRSSLDLSHVLLDINHASFSLLKNFNAFVNRRQRLDNIIFTPIDQISEHFLKIVINTEDPDFFRHKGIDFSRLGLAISSNLEKGRFVKGGSTIPMQLIRNIFLTYDKNIFRKVDEIFLALILENLWNCSKRDILTLYLNIIEFGPDIYGIHQACNFYFSKCPNELTIEHCLVLCYIIPRPIFFYEALMEDSVILQHNIKKFTHELLAVISSRDVVLYNKLSLLDGFVTFSPNLGNRTLSLI